MTISHRVLMTSLAIALCYSTETSARFKRPPTTPFNNADNPHELDTIYKPANHTSAGQCMYEFNGTTCNCYISDGTNWWSVKTKGGIAAAPFCRPANPGRIVQIGSNFYIMNCGGAMAP